MNSIVQIFIKVLIMGAGEPTRLNLHQVLFGTIVSLVTMLIVAAGVAAVILYLRHTKKIVSADHSSEIDEGTGLGNRYYLSRRYREIVKPEKREEYALICIYADSDKLERNFGRDKMLEYVIYVSDYIQKYLTSHDIIARVPGDGLFVLAKVGNPILAEMPDIIKSISRYGFDDPDNLLRPDVYRASAGVYPIKKNDDDIHECIFNAYQTAVNAYDANELVMFCDEKMIAMFSDEREMRKEINKAFDEHQFVTFIQFFVDTMNNTNIVGGEALIRWNHPEKGILSPINFVPFMEKEDLISRLDYYNLDEVCTFIQEMYDHGVENNFYISCNFSRKTFSSHDFVESCLKIFENYTFPKSMIAFEMTESENVKNIIQAYNNAVELKKLGIKLLLDDFGEGFASFYDLTEYPIDGLKIDKALVDNIHTEKGNTILRGMTRMGHELNMKVIVEGVENDDQVRELQNIRCDILQGFKFHRPISTSDAKKTLSEARSEFIKDDSATA